MKWALDCSRHIIFPSPRANVFTCPLRWKVSDFRSRFLGTLSPGAAWLGEFVVLFVDLDPTFGPHLGEHFIHLASLRVSFFADVPGVLDNFYVRRAFLKLLRRRRQLIDATEHIDTAKTH